MEKIIDNMIYVPIQINSRFYTEKSLIKWKILDIDHSSGKILVTSAEPIYKISHNMYDEYWCILDEMMYSGKNRIKFWKLSLLREYLNGEFFQNNFNDDEKEIIIGNELVFNDKIFILSDEEVDIYNKDIKKEYGNFWVRTDINNNCLYNYKKKCCIPDSQETGKVYPCFYMNIQSNYFKSKCNDKGEFSTPYYKINENFLFSVLEENLNQNDVVEIPEGVEILPGKSIYNLHVKTIILPSTLKQICGGAISISDIGEIIFDCDLKSLYLSEYAIMDSKFLIDLNKWDFKKKINNAFIQLFYSDNDITLEYNERTMATMIINQTDKKWKDFIVKESSKFDGDKIKEIIRYINILIDKEKKIKLSAFKLAVEFVTVQNEEYLSSESINELNEILIKKKQNKYSELLLENPRIQNILETKDESIHSIERFVNGHWLQEKIDSALEKKITNGIHYKNSDELCNPKVLIYALSQYEIQVSKKKKLPTSGYKSEWIVISISKEADYVINSLDRNELYELLDTLDSIACIGRYGNEKQIKQLISMMSKWKSWEPYGAEGRKNIIIARSALFLSDTKEAMVYLDKNSDLSYYASLRNTTASDIRDTVLSDVGFDRNGNKIYDLGNKTVEATLNEDLTVSLFDTTAQKVVKSIPKKGADEEKYTIAKNDFTKLKKNIKDIVKNRKETLLNAFLDQTIINASSWKKVYFDNPILNAVAKLLVWQQNDCFFTIEDTKTIDTNGNEVVVNDKDNIYVAHPMNMKADEIKEWQQYFVKNNLKQPFEQVWEPVIDQSGIKENRYKGIMIPYYRFVGKENLHIYVVDADFHDDITISSNLCKMDVHRIDYHRHSFDMNDNYEIVSISFRKYTPRLNHLIVYLDKITAYGRIVNDDTSIQSILDQFTLAQIEQFIKYANENNAMNVLALLLNYKNEKYSDYDPMDEFTLD